MVWWPSGFRTHDSPVHLCGVVQWCVGGRDIWWPESQRAEEEGASFLVSPIKSLPPLPNILQLGPTSQRSYHLPRDPTLAPSL